MKESKSSHTIFIGVQAQIDEFLKGIETKEPILGMERFIDARVLELQTGLTINDKIENIKTTIAEGLLVPYGQSFFEIDWESNEKKLKSKKQKLAKLYLSAADAYAAKVEQIINSEFVFRDHLKLDVLFLRMRDYVRLALETDSTSISPLEVEERLKTISQAEKKVEQSLYLQRAQQCIEEAYNAASESDFQVAEDKVNEAKKILLYIKRKYRSEVEIPSDLLMIHHEKTEQIVVEMS